VDLPNADDHWGLVCPCIYSAVSQYGLHDDPLFRYKYDSLERVKEAQEILWMEKKIIEEQIKEMMAKDIYISASSQEIVRLRDSTYDSYMRRADAKARRKEFFAKADSSVDDISSEACLYDINGWPANIASLKAMKR